MGEKLTAYATSALRGLPDGLMRKAQSVTTDPVMQLLMIGGVCAIGFGIAIAIAVAIVVEVVRAIKDASVKSADANQTQSPPLPWGSFATDPANHLVDIDAGLLGGDTDVWNWMDVHTHKDRADASYWDASEWEFSKWYQDHEHGTSIVQLHFKGTGDAAGRVASMQTASNKGTFKGL